MSKDHLTSPKEHCRDVCCACYASSMYVCQAKTSIKSLLLEQRLLIVIVWLLKCSAYQMDAAATAKTVLLRSLTAWLLPPAAAAGGGAGGTVTLTPHLTGQHVKEMCAALAERQLLIVASQADSAGKAAMGKPSSTVHQQQHHKAVDAWFQALEAAVHRNLVPLASAQQVQ
jgi:hypothetical protein